MRIARPHISYNADIGGGGGIVPSSGTLTLYRPALIRVWSLRTTVESEAEWGPADQASSNRVLHGRLVPFLLLLLLLLLLLRLRLRLPLPPVLLLVRAVHKSSAQT